MGIMRQRFLWLDALPDANPSPLSRLGTGWGVPEGKSSGVVFFKAFDRVPREVVRWALRQLGVEEWLVQTVMAMYERARTVVRTKQGYSTEFEVKVGVHQGSVLSPLLFVAVMEVVT